MRFCHSLRFASNSSTLIYPIKKEAGGESGRCLGGYGKFITPTSPLVITASHHFFYPTTLQCSTLEVRLSSLQHGNTLTAVGSTEKAVSEITWEANI